MISISQIDGVLNSGREYLLSNISRAPESAGIQSIFWVLAGLMIIILGAQLWKGGDAKKGWLGPFAIIIFCGSIIFGFSVTVIGWIILAILLFSILNKVREGEWQGVVARLIPVYIIGYILSANVYIYILIAALASVIGGLAKKANFARTFGTSAAAKILNKEGYPVQKERKIIRSLEKIARKGFDLSKDKLLRMHGKIKNSFALREARNLEAQEHEAEIAAAGKEAAETIDALEKNEIESENRDMDNIAEILRNCEELKRQLQSVGQNAVDEQRKNYILNSTRTILHLSNTLVKSKLEEESAREKANKLLDSCMKVIGDASKEAIQLKESRSVFNDLRKSADNCVKTIKSGIDNNIAQLQKAHKEADHSKAEGSKERDELIEQRQKILKDADGKLSYINKYVDQVMFRLGKINLSEDRRIQAVHNIERRAETHKQRLALFTTRFDELDKKLKAEHKKFSHIYKEEISEIPDLQLIELTDSIIMIFQHLKDISQLSYQYNSEQLKPFVAEMAEIAKDLTFLSQISEYLTKMYYRLSLAMEELNKMSQIVDQNAESKKQLDKILQEEQSEEQLTKRAYKKGKLIQSQVRGSYDTLRDAYNLVNKHTSVLEKHNVFVGSARVEVGRTLNAAFKVTLKSEIKQAGLLDREAAKAEEELKLARRAEAAAAHV
jgi:hypothetical protein